MARSICNVHGVGGKACRYRITEAESIGSVSQKVLFQLPIPNDKPEYGYAFRHKSLSTGAIARHLIRKKLMKLGNGWLLGSLTAFFMTTSAIGADCDKSKTQAEMNYCAGAALEKETTKINKTYEEVRRKLDANQKQKLKDVQLAWIKYKDLACQFEASGVEGGSVYPMVLSGCLSKYTAQRNKELETLNHCEEGDLSCVAK